jgi:hypothetical protein
MSAQNPLNTPITPCDGECGLAQSTWQCLIEQIKCKLQSSIFDPLCETEDYLLNAAEVERFAAMSAALIKQLPGGYSEALLRVPFNAHGVREWLDMYELHQSSDMKDLRAIAKGRLTVWNRIGMALGASCRCCSGYRIIVAFALGLWAASIFN